MSWKSHPVNQNANIAENESHRNRRKRRIVKRPDHSNKCRLGGLQFVLLSPGLKHTRDDFAAMLNLLYVTWSGIDQSDIFRQWRQHRQPFFFDSHVNLQALQHPYRLCGRGRGVFGSPAKSIYLAIMEWGWAWCEELYRSKITSGE